MAKKKAAKKKSVLKKKLVSKKVPAKKLAKKAAPQKKVPLKAKSVKKTPKAKAVLVDSLLKAGDIAPAFSLPNEKGEIISLSASLGKKVVLYFYPKDDTPGCTQEGSDFRDSFAKVKSKGAVIFGISRDSVKSHLKFQSKYGFPFSLLSDEEGKVCETYGVWKEKNLYGRKYMGIERATFIVDAAGKIMKVYPKVKVTGHVDQVLGDL